MCIFGSCPDGTFNTESSEEAQARYNAMIANTSWNRPIGLQRLVAQSPHLIKKIKPEWMSQADIDRLPRPEEKVSRSRRLLQWLEGCPGGVSTIILTALFAAGCWAAWQLWSMVDK